MGAQYTKIIWLITYLQFKQAAKISGFEPKKLNQVTEN